jgi:hypothetical protein
MQTLRKVYPRRLEIVLTISGLCYLKYYAALDPNQQTPHQYRYERLYNARDNPSTYYKPGIHTVRFWPELYIDPNN